MYVIFISTGISVLKIQKINKQQNIKKENKNNKNKKNKNNKMNNKDEELLFESLDEKFINYNEELNCYTLSSKDIIIQWNFILEIPITSSETIITYNFHTKNGDISFGLDFLPLKGGEIEIIPNNRVPSDKQDIIGSYKVSNEGTVVLYWDNSFSWFAQKDLSYSIQVTQVISILIIIITYFL